MLDFHPNPIAFQIGPLPVFWYGIGYAVGLAAAYLLLVRLAKRAGEDPDLVGNGMIIIAIAALIGGRMYHVIDQWVLYKDDPLKIILPPYTGLGVYGGIITGVIALVLYTRYKGLSFWRWADIIAPALFLMQAIARWGNFFNQELYGPPTTLPWGIPIECAHRIAAYPCDAFPLDTTRFQPLFLYESLSGLLGLLFLLWVGRRFRARLRPGDIILLFFVWYGTTRFLLETLRADNWTFFGIPTAMIVSALFVVISGAALVWRHRPGHATDDVPPTFPERATWGAVGTGDWRTRPIDEPWAHAEGLDDDIDAAADADANHADASDPAPEQAAHADLDPPVDPTPAPTDAEADGEPAHDAGSGTDDEAPPSPA